MTTQEQDRKRKRIETGVKIAAALGIGFLVAPFIFVAIQGLLGLVVAGAIGIAAINFAPVVAVKIANWRLKALKSEAMKNPVETLQNDYRNRETALADFREAINTFSAKVNSFADKVAAFKTQYPEEVEKFASQLSKMKQLLAIRHAKYKDASRELERYEEEIQKAGAIWEMGQAAAEMSKAAGMTEGDFYAKIMVETAINSVTENMNKAFAELETSLLDEEDSTESRQTAAQLNNQTNVAANNLKNSASATETPSPLRSR